MAGMWTTRLLLTLLSLGAADEPEVTRVKFLRIPSFDGTVLNADVSLPRPKSATDKFPVIVMANSWSVPQIEYLVQAQELARAGYIVLEYETRGWWMSGGEIDCAGAKDQKDVNAVISYALNQSAWQPDAERVAMAGISYGAGLALLGAAFDERVKVVVAMSGWTDFSQALFKSNTPSLVWGSLLVLLGHVVGHPEPELDQIYKQLLAGDPSGFLPFAQLRSVDLAKLQARKVPIFMSNNFEDRIFYPQDALHFLERYQGPKRVLLNQGIHASAEIPGLFGLPSHVWQEAKKWLATHLLNDTSLPAPPLLEMQLRSNWKVRETFDLWPSARVLPTLLAPAPRGANQHGALGAAAPSPSDFETITFGKSTGISAGFPIVGEALQVFVDKRIRSKLGSSSRDHAIWYYKEVSHSRLCGTPTLSLDVTASHSKWQVVAYLFGVSRITKVGTLISHGTVTCWNCTAGARGVHHLEMRTLCEDLGGLGMGGLGLALNLFSELYEPANQEAGLSVSFHYSKDFALTIPETDSSSASANTTLVV